ncbi:NAD-dependent epimerase/dehydratase family protein [Lysobacter sp. A3-1-A15]|uniref:NAD-dependent epimerase/dehydratase family protein n=2 Tax=Novilysobacter viscosus TaxID=3098602 RepID=UPI003982F992
MRALIFGASGQVGMPVLSRLRAAGWSMDATSRVARGDVDGVTWHCGSLDAPPPTLPAACEAIFSCGPLDAFARWYAANGIDCPRVVAFGSTSARVKHGSPDPAERDVAMRLAEAEASLLGVARERGAAATVLRPTLVYGAGRDATLTRIAVLARRRGVFPLPRGARGLRQPVHVEDLADAAVACLRAPAAAGRAFDLPGGETLEYREMVARVLACLQPPARLLELPAPLFELALRAAGVLGFGAGPGDAAVARMREDLVFDAGAAVRELGYAPRPFRPEAMMFDPPG